MKKEFAYLLWALGFTLTFSAMMICISGCNDNEKKKAEEAKAAAAKAKESEQTLGKTAEAHVKQLEEDLAKSEAKTQLAENKLQAALSATPADPTPVDPAKAEAAKKDSAAAINELKTAAAAARKETDDLKKKLETLKSSNEDDKKKPAKTPKDAEAAAQQAVNDGTNKPPAKSEKDANMDSEIQKTTIASLKETLKSDKQDDAFKATATLERLAINKKDADALAALQEAAKDPEAPVAGAPAPKPLVSEETRTGISSFLSALEDPRWSKGYDPDLPDAERGQWKCPPGYVQGRTCIGRCTSNGAGFNPPAEASCTKCCIIPGGGECVGIAK